jgi:hypothetical protein
MRVFVSWSGEASKVMAKGFHKFTQQVLGRADPWMSTQDIEVGTRWGDELRDAIAKSGFCVICVTKQNVQKPWLNYEAGAIRDGLNKPTAPWMLDITPEEFPQLPLNPLQGRACTKEGTLELVQSINKAMGEAGKEASIVADLFDKCWPELEKELTAARGLVQQPKKEERSERELLAEVLTNTRAILGRVRSSRFEDGGPVFDERFYREQIRPRRRDLGDLVVEFLLETPGGAAKMPEIMGFLDSMGQGGVTENTVRRAMRAYPNVRLLNDRFELVSQPATPFSSNGPER